MTRIPDFMKQSRPITPHRTHKACGCTGVRWCAKCLDPELRKSHKMDPPLALPRFLEDRPLPGTPGIVDFDFVSNKAPRCPDFTGLIVIPEFLSPAEELDLLAQIESTPFTLAQSGKQKQHFGAKVNFNKQQLNASAFKGLPDYLQSLEARLRDAFLDIEDLPIEIMQQRDEALRHYETTDLFVLRYHERDASNLDLHVDDTFSYGEAIFDVSLESDSFMTFTRPADEDARKDRVQCVRVPLPARSAAFLFGNARYEWEHGILAYDIKQQRTSITLRTLSSELRKTPEGQIVLAVARKTTKRKTETTSARCR